MNTDDLLLPPRAVLLHIGPHKTGTTALQGALRLARPELKKHDVVYAGRERQHMFAALAVTGGKGLLGDPRMEMRHWDRLVRQVNRARDKRVVVSSEFFDGADDDTARKVVDELGGSRVHVVITLRPLAKIMPSAWQQYVRNRLRATYNDWLEAMLRRPPYVQPTTTFWKRHHHDVLVERWVQTVGPDNLTVIVVDESDRNMLTRTFEQMLGLPPGLLVPETGWMNRSLTLGEIELVRLLNVEFKQRGWTDVAYKQFVRLGVVRQLQAARRPEPGEPQIVTPKWALERAAEIGAEAARRIEKTGARIIGDISTLGLGPRGDEPEDISADVPVLPSSAAVQAVIGAVIVGGGGAVAPDSVVQPQLPASAEDRPVRDIGTRELARVLGQRVRARVAPGRSR
ncbi:MAG TPA: hypothetical protein VFT62_04735 [Mycobacteriales bacterium]|nr:hypothetical protein [Mycobacteriales bacterium]